MILSFYLNSIIEVNSQIHNLFSFGISLLFLTHAGPSWGDSQNLEFQNSAFPLTTLSEEESQWTYQTYAAPLEESNYLNDEAYTLSFEGEKGNVIVGSDSAGLMKISFSDEYEVTLPFNKYVTYPRVTQNMASGFVLESSPILGVKSTQSVALATSEMLVYENSMANLEAAYAKSFHLIVEVQNTKKFSNMTYSLKDSLVYFEHEEAKGSWSEVDLLPFGFKEHKQNYLRANAHFELWVNGEKIDAAQVSEIPLSHSLKLVFAIALKPLEKRTIKIIRLVEVGNKDQKQVGLALNQAMQKVSNSRLLNRAARRFQNIPKIPLKSARERMIYWQSFSLMDQMFFKPLGNTSFPFYVFSREPTWSWGHDGQVFHESIAMQALAYMNPSLAMDSQRFFISRQRKNGYIPYRIGPFVDRDFIVKGEETSSAPLFSWTNLEIFKVTRDVSFLKEAYESSKKFVGYIMNTRDKDGDGLYEWGGHAFLESVRDGNNVIWKALGGGAEAPKALEALDLNCMVAKELLSLSEMARELGLVDEKELYAAQYARLKALINETFWDANSLFYFHVNKKDHSFSVGGKDLKRMEMIGFLPLWAGVANKFQAAELKRHLTNPQKFWRAYGIPSLAADDPFYQGLAQNCCSWNGPVWLPWQYMISRGFRDYGYSDIANQILEKNIESVSYGLETSHNFFESYSPDHLATKTIAPYIWDGIIAKMMIERASLDGVGNEKE